MGKRTMKLKKYNNQKTEHSEDRHVYIGREEKLIYIGGPHSLDFAQIHLNEQEFIWLYQQMGKMVIKPRKRCLKAMGKRNKDG